MGVKEGGEGNGERQHAVPSQRNPSDSPGETWLGTKGVAGGRRLEKRQCCCLGEKQIRVSEQQGFGGRGESRNGAAKTSVRGGGAAGSRGTPPHGVGEVGRSGWGCTEQRWVRRETAV